MFLIGIVNCDLASGGNAGTLIPASSRGFLDIESEKAQFSATKAIKPILVAGLARSCLAGLVIVGPAHAQNRLGGATGLLANTASRFGATAKVRGSPSDSPE